LQSRLRADDQLFGMYGLPPCRKRKMRMAGWSAQMYSAFVGVIAPGQDGMRRALFPLSNAVSGRLLPDSGFESAGFDRCAISLFASRPGRKFLLSSRSRWAVDVGIAQRFPSLALLPGVICRPVRLPLHRPKPEADRLLRWQGLPRPSVQACWPGPRRRRCNAFAM
jgi:hypothetical protein